MYSTLDDEHLTNRLELDEYSSTEEKQASLEEWPKFLTIEIWSLMKGVILSQPQTPTYGEEN